MRPLKPKPAEGIEPLSLGSNFFDKKQLPLADKINEIIRLWRSTPMPRDKNMRRKKSLELKESIKIVKNLIDKWQYNYQLEKLHIQRLINFIKD